MTNETTPHALSLSSAHAGARVDPVLSERPDRFVFADRPALRYAR